MNNIEKQEIGQVAVEYMLLLMAVVTIVLIGFKTYLPQSRTATNQYFNRLAEGIMGTPNPCGDGVCDVFESMGPRGKCCVDCGGC